MCLSVLFGIFSGCFGTLMVSIVIQILGLNRCANGYGFLLLFEAAGQLTGGPLAGISIIILFFFSITLTFR